ncbi:MAG: VIT family protein [Rhodospirillales bacterium]|nr:VIT family protein [Rhodospirillales bacterium]
MSSRLVYEHKERHFVTRTGWLRAAVLGANDGIISVSSLVVGLAAASSGTDEILLAGVAGLVAGAMSMAAGEYVSVSSQSDLEKADLARERRELVDSPQEELQELTDIYIDRGLEPDLARQVATQLTEKDALGAHARDELGIFEHTEARPLQAAIASAAAFSCGGIWPVLSVLWFPSEIFITASTVLCLVLLGILGSLAAKAGGARPLIPTLRVMFWGAVAMGATALIGKLIGVTLVG